MNGEPVATAGGQDVELARLVSVARKKGQPDVYVGKRRWTRHAIGMKLEASTDPRDPSKSWGVVTHNVSGGGLGFWSRRSIDVGASIAVREWREDRSAKWIPAQVTHCRAGIRGYLIGAAADHPAPPDAETNRDRSAEVAEGDEAPKNERPRAPRKRRSLRAKCACASALSSGVGLVAASLLWGYGHLDGQTFWLPTAGTLVAFAISALVGWFIVSDEVKFLKCFRQAVPRIAAGHTEPCSLSEPPSKELVALQRALLDLAALWRQREDDTRIQRQKLEELNQIKTNILSMVSHDLRTPLTSILLYAQMLTEELDTLEEEDQRRFLGIIAEECTRLSRLVDDLLEVQRLEAGRAHWDIRPQHLSQTIASCARVFEALAISKSIQFEVDFPKSLPQVEADPDRISQVLSNLLSNALKYTPAGGVVRVSAEGRANEVVIRVSDTGPGIPRDKWDQIFDRFSQLSNTNVREIAGVGLGLYIVRQIVERHGGVVWLDSEVGRGSDFYVSLPTQVSRVEAEPSQGVNVAAGRVLVCDADPELAAMIAQTLRAHNFEVRVAHGGCRLLAALEQSDTDVVVTDVLLPDMDATELLDALQSVTPRNFKLVIHSYASDAIEWRRRGADVIVDRPASRQDLVQAVQVAMRKRANGCQTVLLVGDGLDSRRLSTLLAERGYMPVIAETLATARTQFRHYPVDVVALADQSLLDAWERLQKLNISAEDNTRVIVLCGKVRKKDRRLAETYGVCLAPYQPGMEENVVEMITASRHAIAAGSHA